MRVEYSEPAKIAPILLIAQLIQTNSTLRKSKSEHFWKNATKRHSIAFTLYLLYTVISKVAR